MHLKDLKKINIRNALIVMEWKKVNRYLLYLLSLFIISLGASLSIKANLGTSPLICLPYVCSLITNLSVGIVVFLFTVVFILIQIVLLGKGFEKRQYLQFIICSIFSFFIEFSLMLVNSIKSYWIHHSISLIAVNTPKSRKE